MLRVKVLVERSRAIQHACAAFYQREAQRTQERLRRAVLPWEDGVTAADLRQAAEDQRSWLEWQAYWRQTKEQRDHSQD